MREERGGAHDGFSVFESGGDGLLDASELAGFDGGDKLRLIGRAADLRFNAFDERGERGSHSASSRR